MPHDFLFFLCVTITVKIRAVRRIEPTREFLGDHGRIYSYVAKNELREKTSFKGYSPYLTVVTLNSILV